MVRTQKWSAVLIAGLLGLGTPVLAQAKTPQTAPKAQQQVAPKEIKVTGVVAAASLSELKLRLPTGLMTFKPDPHEYGIDLLMEDLNAGEEVRISYRDDAKLGRLVTSVEVIPKAKQAPGAK
ncbi:MAG: hypothetical protein EOO71_21390 [Myxococcaceae bacterium]|nr:MAG: hypothetical protein EOO71_21390 [Myxococcaceae bacterium]